MRLWLRLPLAAVIGFVVASFAVPVLFLVTAVLFGSGCAPDGATCAARGGAASTVALFGVPVLALVAGVLAFRALRPAR